MTLITSKADGVDIITAADMNSIVNKIQTTNATNLDSNVNFDHVYNVKNYGAKGDAGTNDAAAIVLAAAAVPASGGTLLFPPGTYIVGGVSAYGFTVPSNTRILGRGATLKAANATNFTQGIIFVDYGKTNVIIEGLTVDGNKANQTTGGEGIQIRRATGVEIKSCVIQNCYSNGIITFDNTPNATYRITVANTRVESCRKSGVFLGGYSDHVIVRGCFFLNNGSANAANTGDVYCEGGSGSPTRKISVVGNIFDTWLGTDINSASIHLRDLGDADGEAVISQNQIFGSAAQGILISGGGGGQNVSILNNVIRNCVGVGMYIEDTKQTSIIGNICIQNQMGIDVTNFSLVARDVIVQGNFIAKNTDVGIHASSGPVDDNVVITGNICKNNATAVPAWAGHKAGILAWGQKQIIIGNRCYDDQGGPTQQYGISDNNSAGNIGSSNMYAFNDVRGNGTSGMTILGTGHEIRGNTGYNPLGMATFTIHTSPYTYTNSDLVPEMVTIYGGTVSSFVRDGFTIGTASPLSAWLEPGQKLKVVYSVTPNGVKDRK